MTETESHLRIIAWNVYTGSSVDKVRAELKAMIDANNPGVLALLEASKMYGNLEGLGYQVKQLKPHAKRKGNISGTGEIALMIRNDITVEKSFVMSMLTFWKGPNHGWGQDPRVYRWVLLKKQGKTWKVGAAHTPFGTAARAESRKRLVRWSNKVVPGRPAALVLDANMNLKTFRQVIAGPGGLKSTGVRIDLIGYKNAQLTDATSLGNHGSDHPAMRYTLKA